MVAVRWVCLLLIAVSVARRAEGQAGLRELSNDDMLARLQRVGGDDVDSDEGEDGLAWDVMNLQRAQAAIEEESQYQKVLREKEKMIQEARMQQLATDSNNLETRQFFQTLASSSDNDLDALRNMLRNGVSVNRINKNGETPLHVACAKGQAEVVSLLLTAGADPNARVNVAISEDEMTPLSWCVIAGHFDAAEAILDSSKIDVNMHFLARQMGGARMTALDLAYRNKDDDMVALLQEYKAKVYADLSAAPSPHDSVLQDIIEDEEAFHRFLNLEA